MRKDFFSWRKTGSLDLVLLIRVWSEGSRKREGGRGGWVSTQHLGQHPGQVEAASQGPVLLATGVWPVCKERARRGYATPSPPKTHTRLLCSRFQGGPEIKASFVFFLVSFLRYVHTCTDLSLFLRTVFLNLASFKRSGRQLPEFPTSCALETNSPIQSSFQGSC